MTSFILAAAALMLAVLLLLLRPWLPQLRSKRLALHSLRVVASADFSAQLNADIHRDRLAELERDRASGVLADADYAEARDELQRQLLDDTASVGHVAAEKNNSRRHGIAIALALLLPALVIGLYARLGTPAALVPETERTQQAATEMDALVAQLAQKMEQHPDDPQGWAMLARSYKALGRWDEAERAFARIPQPIVGKDPGLLADMAEVLAQKSGRFEGRPRELLAQALRLDANAPQALLLSGVDAFDSKRYAVAIEQWQRLLKVIEPGSENAQMVEAGITRARERLGQKVPIGDPKRVQSKHRAGAGETANVVSNVPTVDTKTMARTAVSGHVELTPALRAKAAPGDTVFIFARAVNGPRMPLAVKRVTVADLPLDFSLDDSMAMQPGRGISSAAELRIEARVSKSGQATPQPGDLTGTSAPVKPGVKGIHVVIDTAGN